MLLSPSILAADLADLRGAAEICSSGGADLIHFDVMDGHHRFLLLHIQRH